MGSVALMTAFEALLIFGGGFLAGFVNSMAGGGSLVTVPLLSLAGVEGLLANGTNRVAVLLQNVGSGYGYFRRRVVDRGQVVPILLPALAGGFLGAMIVSRIDDAFFERIFGVLMMPMLVLSLWKPRNRSVPDPWPTGVNIVVFFAVGVYAGAIQAGVGLIMLMLLGRAGHDLVTANAIKTYVILGVTTIAVVVFALESQVVWVPALVLSAGMTLGGYLGSQIAVDGGERVIKPVLVASVVALAGRMIGLY
jgi:uncharacterized protein